MRDVRPRLDPRHQETDVGDLVHAEKPATLPVDERHEEPLLPPVVPPPEEREDDRGAHRLAARFEAVVVEIEREDEAPRRLIGLAEVGERIEDTPDAAAICVSAVSEEGPYAPGGGLWPALVVEEGAECLDGGSLPGGAAIEEGPGGLDIGLAADASAGRDDQGGEQEGLRRSSAQTLSPRLLRLPASRRRRV